jgi:cell division protein FtsA
MMSGGRQGSWVAGIDIGRSKVAVVIGRMAHDRLEVIGNGCQRFRATDRGQRTMIDLAETERALSAALIEAARMGDVAVPRRAFVATSAHGPASLARVGRATVRGEVVESRDVVRALEDAQANQDDAATAHIMPTGYILDGERRVSDPLGKRAHRIEAHVQRLTISKQRMRAIEQVAKSCDIALEGIAVDVLAASEATLLPSEKEEGVVLIDFGHCTTDVAVWKRGVLLHTMHLPAAGAELNLSIREALGVKYPMAERLCREYGVALTDVVDRWETIPLPQRNGKPYERRVLGTICEPRIREIFAEVRRQLKNHGLSDGLQKAVLTGGTSMLVGMAQVCTETLGMETRHGKPRRLVGRVDSASHPSFATAIGALLLSAGRHRAGADTSGLYPIVRESAWQQWSRRVGAAFDRLF